MGRVITTDLGVVSISKEVIATLAGMAATECYGIVGMVSSRIFSDGISELLGREALSKGVEVAEKDDELYIKVNIVVGYGTKISVIAANVMEKVQYTVERYTGIVVNRVEVNIQGVRVVD